MKKSTKYFLIIFILCFVMTSGYILYISFFPSRELVAKHSVENWLFELVIDEDLFDGPILIEENKWHSTFQFLSTVPKYGDTIIELIVGFESISVNVFDVKGKRPSLLHLRGTRRFPLNQAMLNSLFGLPPSPNSLSEDQIRFIDVPLTELHVEAVADFIEIKRQLMEYYFKYNIGYPDSLAELDNIQFLTLKDIYTENEWGDIYFYRQMGDYVILGDPGEDRKWDFDSFLIDSLYANDQDYIITADDDIIVKFRPVKW